jgi:hypothetical protein
LLWLSSKIRKQTKGRWSMMFRPSSNTPRCTPRISSGVRLSRLMINWHWWSIQLSRGPGAS